MDGDLEIVFRQSAAPTKLATSMMLPKPTSVANEVGKAFNTVEVDERIEGFENKYRLLGFNTKGNMIEVLYNLINDHRVNVFHAFPCSDAFLKSLPKKEN